MCVNMNRQVISNIGRGPDHVKKANKEDLIIDWKKILLSNKNRPLPSVCSPDQRHPRKSPKTSSVTSDNPGSLKYGILIGDLFS